MKQTVQMQKVQARMAPGVITRDGFLGEDRRPLIDILLADGEAVKAIGLDHAAIAARMVELRDAGMAGLGEFVDVAPHFEVRVDSVRGRLPCPFGDPGIFPKTNVTVRNTHTGREITYTGLHIHLVRVHGFYEGHGSPFRLEPRDLAEVLEIA
jgi:hypothetical protein